MITKVIFSAIFVIVLSLTFTGNPMVSLNPNGIIQIALAESLPVVINTERGDTWEKTIYSDGYVVHTLGKPEFVETSSGYKAYDITTTPTKINVNSKVTPLSFTKSNCTNEIFERDDPNTFIEQEYWSLVTNSGSGWVLYDALSLACDYSTSKDSDSQNLTVHRSHPKGEFYSTYSLLDDGTLTKPLLTFVNNPASNGTSVAGLQNMKVSFANVWNNVHVSGLNINGTQISGGTLSSMFPVNEPVIVTKSDIAGLLQGKSVSFSTNGSNEFIFDSTLGFDDLVAMQITRNPDNTVNIVWIYGKPTNITLGQTITLDPTFGFVSDSVYGVTTTSSANTNCNSGSTLNSISFVTMEDSATSGNCDFFSSQFDVTNVPDGSNLRSAQLKLTVDVASDVNCDINAMIAKPSTETASDLKSDINNGTSYIDNNTWCTSIGQKILTLPDSFQTDCESKLTNNWCAIGFTFNSITRDATDHSLELSDIQLILQYGTNITPNIPTLDSVAQIADTGSLLLTYTNATNFDNSTQPAIANYTIFTGETLFLNTPIKNHNATQETSSATSIGAITTSSNFEGLFHFDSDVRSTYNFTDYSGDNNHAKITKPVTIGDAVWGTSATATSETFATYTDQTDADASWSYNDALTRVDVTTDVLDQVSKRDTTVDGICYDLVSVDTSFVLRAKIRYTANAPASVSSSNEIFGLFSGDKTVSGSTAQDYIGLSQHWIAVGDDNNLQSAYGDGQDIQAGGSQGAMIDPFTSSSVNRWLEIIRNGTSVTYQLYTDAYVTKTGTTQNETVPLTVTGLRYMCWKNVESGGTITGGYTTEVDDIEFWNAQTSANGEATIKTSHINSGFSNEVQFSDAGLNVTSTVYPEAQQAWTVNAIVTNNGTTSIPLISSTMSVGTFLCNVASAYVGCSINGVDLVNKTISPTMRQNSANAVTISRTVAGIYEIFVNGTSQGTTTDTTTLGTSTGDKYFIGMKPDLTNSKIWRLEELSVRSDAQTTQDSIDFGLRIVPFSTLATGQTVISPASGTYTDTSVGFDDPQCYQVSAWNSIGQSSRSNIKCNTSDSEAVAGGGGSGSASGGGGTENLPTQISNALLLNLGSKTFSHSLGEKRTYSLELLWDKTKEFSLTVNSIKIGQGSFDSLSIVPELLPLTGKKIVDGKGEIFLTVDAPGDRCDQIQVTARCVYVKTYTIPVTVSVTDLLGTSYTDIPAVLTISVVEKFPIGLAIVVILLLAVSYPIAKIISQNSKKSGRKSPKQMQKDHKKALKKSEKMERKQAKHDMNLFKKIKKEF